MMGKFRKIRDVTAVICVIALVGGFVAYAASEIRAARFVPQPEYVTGEVESVTNYTPTAQSIGAPLSAPAGEYSYLPDVPSAIGVKGTESNPLVVLEIVPDHTQETLSYFVTSKDEGLPFDPDEFGAKYVKAKSGQSIADRGIQNFANYGFGDLGGVFNNNNSYSIYSGDSAGTEKSVPYGEICVKYEIDADDILSVMDQNTYNNSSVAQLINNYPALFKTDSNGVKIGDYASTDAANWKKASGYHFSNSVVGVVDHADFGSLSMEELIAKYPDVFSGAKAKARANASGWTKSESQGDYSIGAWGNINTGYLYDAGPGNGTYAIDSLSGNADLYVSSNSSKNRWILVSNVSELPASAYDIGGVMVTVGNQWYSEQKTKYYRNSWEAADGRIFIDDAYAGGELVGGYFSVGSINIWNYPCSLGSIKNVYKHTFTYSDSGAGLEYYGLKVHDILKRRLIFLRSNEAYENYHIKVISLTPEEINAMGAQDTSTTIDYIERADVVHVTQFNSTTDNSNSMLRFYKRYVNGGDTSRLAVNASGDTNSNFSTIYDYSDNDLEWNLVQKLMTRLSTNSNLPMIYDTPVGTLASQGLDGNTGINSAIYMNDANKDVHQAGSLNNICKMYITTMQLDLLKKAGTSGRSFAADILPNFKQIKLSSTAISGHNTARYTGWYDRNYGMGVKRAECSDNSTYADRAFYLWGKLFFWPSELAANASKDDLKKYGFSENFLNSNNVFFGDLSHANDNQQRYRGEEGEGDGNVLRVYDSEANENKSLFNNSDFNFSMGVAEYILSNTADTSVPLTVKVLKNDGNRYIRMSDNLIMIDYHKDDITELSPDATVVVKVRVDNANNRESVVEKFRLKSPGGTQPTKEVVPVDRDGNEVDGGAYYIGGVMKTGKSMVTMADGETVEENDAEEAEGEEVKGYIVPSAEDGGKMYAYIPVKVSDWLDGYTRIQVKSRARFSYKKGKKAKNKHYVTAKSTIWNIDISERAMLMLE